MRNRHNHQMQKISNIEKLDSETVDVVMDDCSTLPNTSYKLQQMVGAINIARNKTDDPELKLMFQKILRAGGVVLDV